MKEYNFKINGNEYNVAVNSVLGNKADVTVNGTSYQVELEEKQATQAVASSAPVSTSAEGTAVSKPAPTPSGAGKAVKSPLPGVIVSVNVSVGDVIKAGQVIAVLEAMKMENDIQAESDGIITAVKVATGDSILEGDVIVTLG